MNIELIKSVDFGEIDGYGDPNLEKYFLDNGYWEKIVDKSIFFVVGKKGTGKSSVFRMIEREAFNNGSIVVNKDFGEFPFEKLLRLSDEGFAKPNQYQTIWKNVIFNLLIQAIAKLPPEGNDYYNEIVEYRDMFLGSAKDLHKDIISNAVKKEGNIQIKNFGGKTTKETNVSFKYSDDNITSLNSKLSDLILDYFITTTSNNKVVIQFDRLDDNYNQYQNLDEYFQAIISLFKVVYHFNQLLRSKNVTNAKVVIYIRSDIIKSIASRDAESARWDDFRLDLSWKISNLKYAYNSDLYKIVEKRIQTSGSQYIEKTFDDVFSIDKKTLKECKIRGNLFKALVLQTLFRPRDLIELLKILQSEICKHNKFDSFVYNEAKKRYSNWLVNTELANEINPVLRDDYKYVIELLRLCGSRTMSLSYFTKKFKSIKYNFSMSPLELLEYLYGVGIIENTWKNEKNNTYMHRSIFRNEGEFDRNMAFKILPAVWNGLTV